MINQLAIVIPAYKIDFLDNALTSIANQTCKDFTLYIGDDASPHNIYECVKNYLNNIHIVYNRFNTNLGGKDLVKQWERCIDLVNNEKWIWLFSDDDIMDPTCVEMFYKQLNKDFKSNNIKDIYHFNTEIINCNGKVISRNHTYPDNLSSFDFFKKRMKFEIESFVVEYIFSRDIYKKQDGFVQLDLAWGSDHATWIKFGVEKGIQTINGPTIKWRKSDVNITQQNNDYNIIIRKAKANVEFISWSINFFSNNSNKYPLSLYSYNKYIINSLKLIYKLFGYNVMRQTLSTFPFIKASRLCKLHIITHLYIFNKINRLNIVKINI